MTDEIEDAPKPIGGGKGKGAGKAAGRRAGAGGAGAGKGPRAAKRAAAAATGDGAEAGAAAGKRAGAKGPLAAERKAERQAERQAARKAERQAARAARRAAAADGAAADGPLEAEDGAATPGKARRAGKGLGKGGKAGAGKGLGKGRKAGALRAPKIFCLGFDQTGTEALQAFFTARGLIAVQDSAWSRASHMPRGRAFFAATAYSGGELADFSALDRWFPGSLFVLNTRDELAWMKARIDHALRHEADGATPPASIAELDVLAQEFCTAPSLCIDRWILDRRLYQARVRQYFAGQPNFLELNVTDSRDWDTALSAALDAAGFPQVPERLAAAPEVEARPALTFANFPLIQAYYDFAAERVEAFGPDDVPASHAEISAQPEMVAPAE